MEEQDWGSRGLEVQCVWFLERSGSPLVGQGTKHLCANLPEPGLTG